MMCAQHALNAILQGHFYDPSQLAQIADELADHQRIELGISMEDIDQNSHVDETGFFSVDVIDRALNAWDMGLVRWRPCRALADRYEHPEREFAFLLNLESHWIALRGFGRNYKYWYVCVFAYFRFNLNSYFERPQWIGDAYLSTFLEQVCYISFTYSWLGKDTQCLWWSPRETLPLPKPSPMIWRKCPSRPCGPRSSTRMLSTKTRIKNYKELFERA